MIIDKGPIGDVVVVCRCGWRIIRPTRAAAIRAAAEHEMHCTPLDDHMRAKLRRIITTPRVPRA